MRREAHLGPSRRVAVAFYRLNCALSELDAALACEMPLEVRAALQTARTHVIESCSRLRSELQTSDDGARARGPFE